MASRIVRAITASGLSIYDPVEHRPELFLESQKLEKTLNRSLRGLDLNYPIRTRSRVLKSKVCEALGYPIPAKFRRTRPRFPAQNFDTYVQKANNLQIWNEEVSLSRRYVIVRVNEKGIVTKVRVVTGDVIAQFDRTGTLTHKFQAKSRIAITESHLVSVIDTANVREQLIEATSSAWQGFLPVNSLYRQLEKLLGSVIADPGIVQERNRGGSLHRAVRKCLGGLLWRDDGRFPDLQEQLLEVKLQTAPTIDLGLVCPDSIEPIAHLPRFRHCDVRYAVFYGVRIPEGVRLNHLVLSTGADFFTFFQRFEGMVKNKKLQIPLPADFFD